MSFEIVELGSASHNHDGKRKPVKESERKSGIYPYYGASGIVDYVDGYIFDGEYLLIGEDGENLRTRQTPIAFMANGKFWVNNHAHIITGNEKSNTRFLMYAILNTDIQPYLTGAVMPKLTQGNLNKIEIPLPTLLIQNRIANILGTLDKKIELNRQTNQTLEQIAQALFKSWFVDFEPTRAKIAAKAAGATAQEIEQAAIRAISGKTQQALNQLPQTTQQTLKATANLFPEAMEESELGEIPQGWEVKSLSEIINIIGGGTPKRSEESYWNGDIPWFSVRDVPASSDIFVVDTDEKISQLGLQKSSTKLLPVGTTIISARGTVGKLALVATPMCMNQSCYGIQGIDGFGAYFTYFNLREAVDTLLQNVHGAVFDTITTQTFESYSMAICNGEITKQFDVMVEPLLKKIELNVRENNTLSKLRDSLLPKLLSGEIQAH